MKRLALAFTILILLIIYTFFSEKFVEDFCMQMDSVLQECADSITEEKYSRAKSKVSKLYDLWEENDILMSVFIGDDSVIEPQKSIITIKNSLEDENYEECLVNIRECQGYLHCIIENNRVNLGNVL